MEASAEEFIQFIGKIMRKIDGKMDKNPIGSKLLSKEEIKKKDFISIVNKIASRYIYYLDVNEREKLLAEKLSPSFWKELELLEKEKKIKFHIFIGYVMGYEKS